MTDLNFNEEIGESGRLLKEIGETLSDPEGLDSVDLVAINTQLTKIVNTFGLLIAVSALIKQQE